MDINTSTGIPKTPFHTRARHLLFLAAGLVGLGGCGDGRIIDPTVPPMIVLLSGNHQVGTVGTTLIEPLRVQVRRGRSIMNGAEVVWSFSDGEERRDVTNNQGESQVSWTLGTTAGESTALVGLSDYPDAGRWQFSAAARPDTGTALKGPADWESAGYVQLGLAGSSLTFDFHAYVVDSYGNPVPEASIAWEVTQGEGMVTGILPPNPWDVGSWARLTLGPEEGTYRVTATVPGLPAVAPITFEAAAVSALVAVDEIASVYLPEWATTITASAFAPDTVTVTAGQSVGWLWATWYDPEYDYEPSLHDLVFEDDPTVPPGSEPRRWGSLVRTFSEAGTYRYRCTLHSIDFDKGHVGVVTVLPS